MLLLVFLLPLVLARTLLATLLVGNETEGTAAAATPVLQIAHSFKFTAAATGTLTALHVRTSEQVTASGWQVALQEDEAGKPKEGVLAEGNVAATAGANEVSGLSASVVAGTVYWITILTPEGTARYKPGTTTVRRIATTKHTTVAAIKAAEWGAEETKGPAAVWGTGATGATLVGSCTVI